MSPTGSHHCGGQAMPVSHFVKAVLDDQRTRFFLSALFVASLLYLLASTATTAKRSQENGSRKVKLQEFKDIPLRLVEVRHLDSDTWYNDLEIELKNISTKRIYYVLAYLDFPDIPVPDGMYGIPLFFGEDKNSDYRRDPEPNDPYLKPGDTLTFTIPENVRKGIKRHYESLPATVQKLELHISLISFGDGTGFVAERPRDRRVKYAHTHPRKRNHSNRKSSTSTAEPLQDGCGSCARYVLGPREVLCYSGGPCFGKRATTDPSAKCALIKPHFFECGELNCYSDDIYESPICPGFTATPTPSPTPEETLHRAFRVSAGTQVPVKLTIARFPLMDALIIIVQMEVVAIHLVRPRSEEHTSELQSRLHLVCRL